MTKWKRTAWQSVLVMAMGVAAIATTPGSAGARGGYWCSDACDLVGVCEGYCTGSWCQYVGCVGVQQVWRPYLIYCSCNQE